jgi:hypothetical protein
MTGEILNLLTHSLMANKKRENYEKYRQLYPEAHMVFIGDNGQGDPELASMLIIDDSTMRSASAPTLSTFIHNISPRGPQEDTRHCTHTISTDGVVTFQSYAGAAIGAFHQGLLKQESLLRVGQACVREFSTVKFATAKAKMKQQAELMKDVSALQKLLDPEDALRLMEDIKLT